jgi:hypothetical protein
MKTGRKLKSDFLEFGRDIKTVGLKTPTAKALGFVLLLAVLSVFLRSNDWSAWRIRLLEEEFNHYLWFFKTETQATPPIDAVILDLYTSETYSASADLYQSRYQIYALADNLKLSCFLGAEVVMFDLFLNSNSWIGKYLESNEGADDAKDLLNALSCYNKVFMPAARNIMTDGYVPTIKPLLQLGEKLKYIATATDETKLYRPLQLFQEGSGTVSFPYAGFALALEYLGEKFVNPDDYPRQTLPLQFGFHPQSFKRASWEEMTNLAITYDAVRSDDREMQTIVLQSTFESDPFWSQYQVFPKVVLVGFTHNVDDQHDMPFSLFGPIRLSDRQTKSGRTVLITDKGEQLSNSAISGQEPDLPYTPGLYAILSTANTLVSGRIPFYPCYRWPILSIIIFVCLGWISIEWGRQQLTGTSRRLFFGTLMGSYVLLVGFAFWYGIYLPLVVPCLSLVLCYFCSSYLYQRQLAKRLTLNYRYDREELNDELSKASWEDRKPLMIVQAEQALAIQGDSFSVLKAQIDLTVLWVQLLGLFQWADYYWYQQKVSPRAKGDWEKHIRRPGMGHYKNAFAWFGKSFHSEIDAQRSFFPQFYFSLVGPGRKKIRSLEKSLDKAVELRNNWIHFTSSSKGQKEQEDTIITVRSIIELIEKKSNFLKDYSLIKPVSMKLSSDIPVWKCFFYNGPSCYLGEVETRNEFTAESLYLYCHNRSTDIHGSALKLDPWVVAGNCGLHNREELFQFVGYQKGKCLYAGLTKDCKPSFERLMPKDAME